MRSVQPATCSTRATSVDSSLSSLTSPRSASAAPCSRRFLGGWDAAGGVPRTRSFRPKDGGGGDDGDFRGEQRSNETHASKTDPDARPMRKGRGQGSLAKKRSGSFLLTQPRSGRCAGFGNGRRASRHELSPRNEPDSISRPRFLRGGPETRRRLFGTPHQRFLRSITTC